MAAVTIPPRNHSTDGARNVDASDLLRGSVIKTKVWMERGGRFVIGDGGAKLLLGVLEHGSLLGAAREIGWSYRHAWGYLKHAEAILALRSRHLDRARARHAAWRSPKPAASCSSNWWRSATGSTTRSDRAAPRPRTSPRAAGAAGVVSPTVKRGRRGETGARDADQRRVAVQPGGRLVNGLRAAEAGSRSGPASPVRRGSRADR